MLPSTHVHVSEREAAHYWPDGRWDNARWEDCAWDVAIEFVRALGRVQTPATHAEAEALRRASGEDVHSGSSVVDVRRGLLRRYGFPTNPPITGWTTLWNRLVPGTVAHVNGRMGVFSWRHRLRRHDQPFNGTHSWLVFRLDGGNRAWICDPLAPSDGYRGEWVTKAELEAFVRGANLWHIVGTLPKVPRPSPLTAAIASLRRYIARLEAVKTKTKAQITKLAAYRARLAEYLKRR